MSDTGATDWGSILVSLAVLLAGVGLLGWLVYTGVTTSVTRADYDAFSAGCADLAGETALTETGIGLDRTRLNESDARACRNTTFAQYRQGRIDSMWSAPLNPWQWAWFGGFGLLLALGGTALVRQQLRADRG